MKKFTKSQRLLSKPDFDAVMNNGVKVVCPNFILFVYKSATSKVARLGLVVSRKVGGAVERNRVKRCVREVFRLEASDLLKGFDLVVLARPSLTSGSQKGYVRSDIRDAFQNCLQRLVKRIAVSS